jgi:hypothetical protein
VHSLLSARDVDDVLDRARLRGREEVRPRVRAGADAPLFLYEGDAEYDAESPAQGRHRLLMGEPPWIYERSEA